MPVEPETDTGVADDVVDGAQAVVRPTDRDVEDEIAAVTALAAALGDAMPSLEVLRIG